MLFASRRHTRGAGRGSRRWMCCSQLASIGKRGSSGWARVAGAVVDWTVAVRVSWGAISRVVACVLGWVGARWAGLRALVGVLPVVLGFVVWDSRVVAARRRVSGEARSSATMSVSAAFAMSGARMASMRAVASRVCCVSCDSSVSASWVGVVLRMLQRRWVGMPGSVRRERRWVGEWGVVNGLWGGSGVGGV